MKMCSCKARPQIPSHFANQIALINTRMNKTEIANFLLDNTYLVNVFQDGHLVSQGSAFPFNKNGDLLTAAHVITGKLPYSDKDIDNLTIACRKPGRDYGIYDCSILAPSISLSHFKDPIFIDAAILINRHREREVNFFECPESEVVAGTDVLMCGYSDEIEPPLSFQRNLNLKHPDFLGIESKLISSIETHIKLSMVKSGMIGRALKVVFTDAGISGFSLYIDNGIHQGASGGPVVNDKNQVIGIITQRAITDSSTTENPDLKVPSGSTIAISPSLILKCKPS